MVKHVLTLALTLASISASAGLAKLSDEQATTYRKGIREMTSAKYDATVQASGAYLTACSDDTYERAMSSMARAEEVSLDQNSAQPLVEFNQNVLASRPGEVNTRVYIRTNASFNDIASLTVVTTRFENQLVSKDIRNLKYGTVPNQQTEVCTLVPNVKVDPKP